MNSSNRSTKWRFYFDTRFDSPARRGRGEDSRVDFLWQVTNGVNRHEPAATLPGFFPWF